MQSVDKDQQSNLNGSFTDKLKDLWKGSSAEEIEARKKDFFAFFSNSANLVEIPKDFKFNRDDVYSDFLK